MPVVCSRPGRLDPGLLERAVGLLAAGHPELRSPKDTVGVTTGPGLFVHLDLSRALPGEQRKVEQIVGWTLRRCMGRPPGAPFLVVYLDPGAERQGRLILAGCRRAVSDAGACAALSETLLGLYGELTMGDPVLA